MSGYTKLFGSIVHSTVWKLPIPSKVVWVTMMALADRHGVVEASVPGLADLAGVTIAQCEEALESFLSPDKYSRTKDADGRRVEEIDGGWRLINHRKYTLKLSAEDRRDRDAERQRRHRDKPKERDMSRDITGSHASHDTQTQTQTQTQTETKNGSDKKPLAPLGPIVYPPAFSAFWDNIGSTRSKGLKSEALTAWQKAGKPPADALIQSWNEYLQSLGDTFPKDVSRWLKARGWEEKYPPPIPTALARGRPASAYQQTIDSMQGFLDRHEGED